VAEGVAVLGRMLGVQRQRQADHWRPSGTVRALLRQRRDVNYPPPNPDDWLGDALPSRHTSESPDSHQAAPSRQEESMTWDLIRNARPVYDYEPHHAD
jgi:hypothetical protein